MPNDGRRGSRKSISWMNANIRKRTAHEEDYDKAEVTQVKNKRKHYCFITKQEKSEIKYKITSEKLFYKNYRLLLFFSLTLMLTELNKCGTDDFSF